MASAHPPARVRVVQAVQSLALYAAERDLWEADVLLTEILAIVHGWRDDRVAEAPAFAVSILAGVPFPAWRPA